MTLNCHVQSTLCSNWRYHVTSRASWVIGTPRPNPRTPPCSQGVKAYLIPTGIVRHNGVRAYRRTRSPLLSLCHPAPPHFPCRRPRTKPTASKPWGPEDSSTRRWHLAVCPSAAVRGPHPPLPWTPPHAIRTLPLTARAFAVSLKLYHSTAPPHRRTPVQPTPCSLGPLIPPCGLPPRDAHNQDTAPTCRRATQLAQTRCASLPLQHATPHPTTHQPALSSVRPRPRICPIRHPATPVTTRTGSLVGDCRPPREPATRAAAAAAAAAAAYRPPTPILLRIRCLSSCECTWCSTAAAPILAWRCSCPQPLAVLTAQLFVMRLISYMMDGTLTASRTRVRPSGPWRLSSSRKRV